MTRDNRVVRGNDGRKLDHKTLEVLRLRALDQVRQSAHPGPIFASASALLTGAGTDVARDGTQEAGSSRIPGGLNDVGAAWHDRWPYRRAEKGGPWPDRKLTTRFRRTCWLCTDRSWAG